MKDVKAKIRIPSFQAAFQELQLINSMKTFEQLLLLFILYNPDGIYMIGPYALDRLLDVTFCVYFEAFCLNDTPKNGILLCFVYE